MHRKDRDVSKRYGRNQKRRAREEVAQLRHSLNYTRSLVDRAEQRAKPFDAQRLLIDRPTEELGPKMRPYIERMMKADERNRAPLHIDSFTDMASAQSVEIIRARFDLAFAVAI